MPSVVYGAMASQHRQFVNELRGQLAADVHATQAAAPAIHLDRSDHFAVLVVDLQHLHRASHRGHNVQQGSAGRVQTQRVQHKIAVFVQQSRAEEERRRRHIAWDCRVDALQHLSASQRQPPIVPLELCAKRPQRMFGMIARTHGLRQ